MNRSLIRWLTVVLVSIGAGIAIGGFLKPDPVPRPVKIDVMINCVSVLPAKVHCTSAAKA